MSHGSCRAALIRCMTQNQGAREMKKDAHRGYANSPFGEGGVGAEQPHIRKMAGCLQTKLCPHAVTNKVAISLKETAVGSPEEDYSLPRRCLVAAEAEELRSRGSCTSSRCRLEQKRGGSGMKAASK